MKILSLFDGISAGRVALERAGISVESYHASEIDKYAIKVTQANYPDTVQLGDVTKWREWDIPKPDLIIGGSPCFTGDTRVVCKDKIKPISTIKVGDYVLTHKGNYKKVLATGDKLTSTVNLNAQASIGTVTTYTHPYYIRTRYKEWDSENKTYKWKFNEPEWKEVKDINKGDYVGTPILNSSENPLNLTKDECWVIGAYIGDGHTRKDYRTSEGRCNDRHWQLILSLGEKKKVIIEDKNLDLHFSLYSHTKSIYRAVFSNKRLVEYAEENCGCGAKNKFFSKQLLDLPKELLKEVLDGYLFADGCCRNGAYKVSTVSSQLVQGLILAVAKVYKTTTSVGRVSVPPTTVIEGRVVNQSNYWEATFRKSHSKQSRAWVIDEYIWNPVKEVIPTHKTERVYNLEVKDDNSYVANNHVVHNCQGFSFAGKQLNFNDPRSKLFFEFVDILNHYKPKYFLLENVKMKKEYQDIISEKLGVEPIEINSALVSAQNRKRLYWTNIPNVTQPKDKGTLLKDVIHESLTYDSTVLLDDYIVPFDKSLQILDKEVERGKVEFFRKDSQANRVYFVHNKVVTLCGSAGGGAAKMGQYLFGCITPDRANKRQNGQRFNKGDKFYTLTTQDKHGVLIDGYIRKLTPVECERLQTFPDNYTNHVSNTQRYKSLGNSWTVDVIAHIFNGLEEVNNAS